MSKPHVLVLPGLGDVHWALAKLPGWYGSTRGNLPSDDEIDVSVWSPDARDRGGELIDLCPFTRFAGYWRGRLEGDLALLWKRLYYPDSVNDAIGLMEPFMGFDAVIAPNGLLRYGVRLEDTIPRFGGTWWDWGLNAAICADRPNVSSRPPYVILAVSDYSIWGKHWCSHADDAWVDDVIARLRRRGLGVVLTGAEWDAPYCKAVADRHGPNYVTNMAGQTTVLAWLHLAAEARAVVGFASGATILPVPLGTPAVALWHPYFPEPFWDAWVPLDKIGKTYHALNVQTATAAEVAAHVP